MKDTWYVGSRLLEPLTAVIPLPIDQLNFLVCEIFAIWFGSIFRTKLSPTVVSPYQRHVIEIVMGLILSYFCFGYQVIHIFIQATICYALMKYCPADISHQVNFVIGLGYVCMMHIYRQYYDYGGYTMDITGPLMITSQKITSLGFALYDGKNVPEEKLTQDQKAMMVKQLPHPVSYYGYVMCYHGIMAGPMAFFVEYQDFINGTNYYKPSPSSVSNGSASDTAPPSPKDTVIEKCIKAAFFAVFMVVTPKIVPYDYMYTEEFLYESSFLYRMMYMLATVTCVRCKYYTAFLLSEAVNNAAGFGFNGYDNNGQPKWDLLNNADIWAIETCTSMKVNIESWNVRTALWLRRIVYDRIPKQYGLFGTFLVSALWHGFYPGYYITFFGSGIIIYAGREIRRHIRPLFQTSDNMKQLYEVITFIGTRFCNVYLCAPFCLLTLSSSMKLYWSLYFNIHLTAIAILVFYKFINPPKRRTEKIEKAQ